MSFTMRPLIVAAHRGEVRLLRHSPERGRLLVTETWRFPSARVRNGQLKTMSPGTSFSSFGSARSRLEKKVKPHDVELYRMSASVARRLVAIHREFMATRFILIAEPKVLGALRAALDSSVRDAVVLEMDKNPSHMDEEGIEDAIRRAQGLARTVRLVPQTLDPQSPRSEI
jgi:protein required for attachment to host cells